MAKIYITKKIKYILVLEYVFEIFHNFYQIDVCEAKLSGRILCDTKYSRKDLGMKSQEDDKSNKTRHFCRYIPKMNSEKKDGTLVNDDSIPSFGPELTINLQGNMI